GRRMRPIMGHTMHYRRIIITLQPVNGGVTPIVVTNLVCVPKKKEFVQFSGSQKGQKEYRVGFFSYPYRIKHAEQNLLHGKPALFRSGKSYG
ncbi:hypothetical protein S245_008669, partial [Arachis hypogaea]